MLPDSSTLPLPVASPLWRLERSIHTGERILVAADVGYAVVKYMALARMSDWLHTEEPDGGLQLARSLEGVLFGGSCNHWWRVANELEQAIPTPVLPATPTWGGVRQMHLDRLNRSRSSRHTGSMPPEDRGLAGAAIQALEVLFEAGGPLLELSLIRYQGDRVESLQGPVPPDEQAAGTTYRLAIDTPGGRVDIEPLLIVLADEAEEDHQELYVYERLTQRCTIYERGQFQKEVEEHKPRVTQVLQWVEERRRRSRLASNEQLESLSDEELVERLEDAARDAISREWRASAVGRQPREDVERALSRLPRRQVGVLVLTGPSGIGKTCELTSWLKGTRLAPLWVRAGLRSAESLASLAGTAANGGEEATLSVDRLRGIARGRGLAIAVDGLNEAEDPRGWVTSLVEDLTEIGVEGATVHLVLSTRQDPMTEVIPLLEPRWLAWGDGVEELGPLPREQAAALWDSVCGAEKWSYDRLPPATRRLLQVPLLAALARDAVAFGGAESLDAESIVEAFLEKQTSDLERALLRYLGRLMYRGGNQTLGQEDLDEDRPAGPRVVEAILGHGELKEAYEDLLDKGLLLQQGHVGPTAELRLMIAHDRILQLYTSRWLADRLRGTDGAVDGPGEGWGEEMKRVGGSPALAAALGQTLATLNGDGPMLFDLFSSERPWDRAVAGNAVLALAERDGHAARRWLGEAWEGTRRSPELRAELISMAADAGQPAILSRGMVDTAEVRETCITVLSRLRRHNPEDVLEVLRTLWEGIRRHPLLNIRRVARLLHGLLVALVAEGNQRHRYPELEVLAQRVVGELVGTGQSFWRRLRRELLVGVLAFAGKSIVMAVPSGPVAHVHEIARFFKVSRDTRAAFAPIIRLFCGQLRPDAIKRLAGRIVRAREVAPTVLLERALIVSSLRADTEAEALDLAHELGLEAQRTTPVPMAAQSSLYVLSTFLERHPISHPGWDDRYAQFRELLDGWLAVADRRRWTSASGKKYKSLFVSALIKLRHKKGESGRPPLVDRLWGDVFSGSADDRDRLALDLLDDLTILAVSRGLGALALDSLEPFLARDRWSSAIERQASYLVKAIHDRTPELAQQTLEDGPGKNRRRIRELLPVTPPRATAGHSLFLDFDEALVLNEAVNETVAEVMHDLLNCNTFHEFLKRTLKRTVNRLTGDDLFSLKPL